MPIVIQWTLKQGERFDKVLKLYDRGEIEADQLLVKVAEILGVAIR